MRWKPIKGYEAFYEVSEFGDIRSLERTEPQPARYRNGVYVRAFERFRAGTCLKLNESPSRGYWSVELAMNGAHRRRGVHRYVYEAFIGPLIDGHCVHHKDYNGKNNHYSNLEQMTYARHNNIHRHPSWNKGIKNPKAMVENARNARKANYIKRCEETRVLRDRGMRVKDIAIAMDISTRSVHARLKELKGDAT